MKKIIFMILTFCLILGMATEALAARPEFIEEPETATTTKQGQGSFSVKVKGTANSYTWYFVNPKNGSKTTGKKLAKKVKGVKVSGPNKAKITLSKVPESMHGWLVYCRVSGGGAKIDSNYATLYVYGMEVPEEEVIPGELGFAKQPKDTKIDAEGKVVFSVKIAGLQEKITWGFINPKNGQKVVGTKINYQFKGLKLSGIHGKKLTISGAAQKLVGWKVYAHIKGKNGVEMDSEPATILAADEGE